MLAGLKAVWRGLRHVNQRGYIYIWGSLIWAGMSLLIVTMPAAWAGLVKMSWNAQTSPSADTRDLIEGFKENWKRGLVVFALNALVIGVNVWNLLAYWNAPGGGYVLLRGFWAVFLGLWIIHQAYLWPLFYAMKEPNLRGAFRNAAVMIVLNPLFSLGALLGILVIAVLSSIFPVTWLLIGAGALAAVCTAAVLDRLEAAGIRQPPPVPADVPDVYEFEE